MKIFSTNNFDVDHYQNQNQKSPFTIDTSRKRRKNEFRKFLERSLNDSGEELDEFRILLPTNGHFWDNGYEDKE